MSRNDWIEDAYKRREDEQEFLNKLSDNEFVSFDVHSEIKDLKYSIKSDRERLKYLSRLAKSLPKPPKAPYTEISRQNIDFCSWRFRGRQDAERKLYKLPKL